MPCHTEHTCENCKWKVQMIAIEKIAGIRERDKKITELEQRNNHLTTEIDDLKDAIKIIKNIKQE